MKQLYSIYLTLLTVVLIGFSTQGFSQGNTCVTAINIPVTVNGCVNQQVSNIGLTNSGVIPVCPGFSGGDLWLKVVLPPSGVVTMTAKFVPGVSSLLMDINMAAYTGSCGSLTQVGCDDDSGAGFYPSITVTSTPGNTVYFQLWDTDNNNQSPFNVCANGMPTCTSPTATFTRSCGDDNEYNVSVNLTNLGDASEVNIINDGGAPAMMGITATGTYSVGPFDLGQVVSVTVEHGSDATCNVSRTLSDVGLGCDHIITCGIDLNQTYCYGNNDITKFLYSSPDGSPLTVLFNSGLIQDGVDKVRIYNGSTTSDPLLFNSSNNGDLTGVTRTASSGHLLIQAVSDGGGSCQEGSLGLGGGWNWDISCEGLSACEAATQMVSKTTFAASEIGANLSGVPFSGANECNGPGTNPDLYFKFTAVGSVTYFRVQGGAGFDPAVEVYDGCGGTQLACTNEAGPGQRELFWVTGLTPGDEYVYRVYHAGSGVPATTVFQTAIAHIPTVQLRNDFCGVTNLVASSIIRSTTPNPTFLLDGFVWEFTELEPPFDVYEVNSPNGANPQFRMFWFTDFEYGRTYSLRIKARMYQGPNEGDYGPSCIIGFASEVGSGLQAQYNNGFFGLCDIVKAIKVAGATNYRWTFDDGANVLEYNSNSNNYFCSLQNVNGLELGTSYTVHVFVTDGGVESTSSMDRVINMNGFVPNTSLNPALLACGSIVNLTQGTQAFNVCAASGYTFRFTNLSQPGESPIEKNRPNRAITFSQVPGLIPGDTYSVAVKANAGGLSGDYSSECEITINAPQNGFASNPSAKTTTSTNEGDMLKSELRVSPNPVANGADVLVTISSMQSGQQSIEVRVFDLTGKLIHTQKFANSGTQFNGRIQLRDDLPAGIYLVQSIVNGDFQATEKLIIE